MDEEAADELVGGERHQLVSIAAFDPALSGADCDAHCAAHPMLSRFKRPRAYRFVDELPLTATGKKLHYRLRAQAPDDAAAGLLERP